MMAEYLSVKFGGKFVPEYAREYINSIARHYEYEDVEIIARQQIQQYRNLETYPGIVFFDTWLIITKVWFDWVYGKIPVFIEEAIVSCPIDMFILLKTDLPWKADSTRENGGENRQRLFDRYKHELEYYHFPYREIGGFGNERYANAEKEILCLLK